jgi:hypothetical protein
MSSMHRIMLGLADAKFTVKVLLLNILYSAALSSHGWMSYLLSLYKKNDHIPKYGGTTLPCSTVNYSTGYDSIKIMQDTV